LDLAKHLRCAVLGAWTDQPIRCPEDIDALRALALNVLAERDAAIAERDQLIAMNEKLRQLLRKAQGFEAKSERLARLHPDQLKLALEDIEQTIAKARRSRRRRRLPIRGANGGSTAARCPLICHAFTRRSRQSTPVARVATSRCMSSAKRAPSGST
jgi:hypothetical protein